MTTTADRVADFGTATLHRNLPAAELVELEGLGHRRILTDPQVIDRCCALLISALTAGARA